MKRLCCKCSRLAVWEYSPGNNNDDDYYCESCVNRGCSCIVNDDGIMDTDAEGRELPCVEYDYNKNGFEVIFYDDSY